MERVRVFKFHLRRNRIVQEFEYSASACDRDAAGVSARAAKGETDLLDILKRLGECSRARARELAVQVGPFCEVYGRDAKSLRTGKRQCREVQAVAIGGPPIVVRTVVGSLRHRLELQPHVSIIAVVYTGCAASPEKRVGAYMR